LSGNTGAVIWSRQINGTAGQGETANHLAVDPNDNVVVAGFIRNVGTGLDFTIIKFSGTTGVSQWSQVINGAMANGFDEAEYVVTDWVGDVYATGYLTTETVHQNLIVIKFASADGSEIWRNTTADQSRGHALVIDSMSDVTAAGELQDIDQDFGLVKLDGATGFDFPVADSDGDGIPDDEDQCPDSDLSPTVVIDSCDSGVDNMLFMGNKDFGNGCTIADLILEIAESAENHGGFVSGVAELTNDLQKDGIITGKERSAIQRCVAQANIP